MNIFCSNIMSLKTLNIEQLLEDIILSQLVEECLERQTRRKWQMKQVDKGFPTLKELITFMEQKCKDLETLKASTNAAHLKETQGGKQQQRSAWGITTFVATTENKCVLSHIVCLNVQWFL